MIIRQMNKDDINAMIDCIKTQALDADLPSSDEIDVAHLSHVIRDALIDPRYYVLVAVEQDHIIGFCAGMLTMKHWNPRIYGEIFFIYTHPEKRSKKLADSLFDGLVDWFTEQKCAYVITSVLHFDEHYKPREDYMRKGDIYFKSKNLQPIGQCYIKGINGSYEGV